MEEFFDFIRNMIPSVAGAFVGTLAGAFVARYYARQDGKLRERITTDKLKITTLLNQLYQINTSPYSGRDQVHYYQSHFNELCRMLNFLKPFIRENDKTTELWAKARQLRDMGVPLFNNPVRMPVSDQKEDLEAFDKVVEHLNNELVNFALAVSELISAELYRLLAIQESNLT